jgi:hypothetical protein
LGQGKPSSTAENTALLCRDYDAFGVSGLALIALMFLVETAISERYLIIVRNNS